VPQWQADELQLSIEHGWCPEFRFGRELPDAISCSRSLE